MAFEKAEAATRSMNAYRRLKDTVTGGFAGFLFVAGTAIAAAVVSWGLA